MKFDLNCRAAAHLVLERQERRLTFSERLRLRVHLLICKACPHFVRQLSFMRGAVGRWEQYAEGDGTPPRR